FIRFRVRICLACSFVSFINPLFMRSSLASGDQPDNLFTFLVFPPGMSNHDNVAIHKAKCLPPLFACNKTVLKTQRLRILKYKYGAFKSYAMFTEILAIFCLIPLEAHRS